MECAHISFNAFFFSSGRFKQGRHSRRRFCREKDLDETLQISNVFVNVSKGEVAKSNDLKKSFGTDDRNAVAREVHIGFSSSSFLGRPPADEFCSSFLIIIPRRSSAKAKFKSERRSENTTSRPSDARSPLSSPRSA